MMRFALIYVAFHLDTLQRQGLTLNVSRLSRSRTSALEKKSELRFSFSFNFNNKKFYLPILLREY